ncbi:hypothetical protein F5144DRAFT_209476 [Chaetomium tenue]|uniref:Uncharacterized protein n=1 Tax=Chaetomium tenue TaxID=1854479 RepID=A0ACB7PEM1_9PEZI|nr:hypothetical protein F5144DRAFT_209476 [Chaetomium globosum]
MFPTLDFAATSQSVNTGKWWVEPNSWHIGDGDEFLADKFRTCLQSGSEMAGQARRAERAKQRPVRQARQSKHPKDPKNQPQEEPPRTSNEFSPTPGRLKERTTEDMTKAFELYWERKNAAQKKKEEELQRKEKELREKEENLDKRKAALEQKADADEKEQEIMKEEVKKIYRGMNEMKTWKEDLIETLKHFRLEWVLGIDEAGKGRGSTRGSPKATYKDKT